MMPLDEKKTLSLEVNFDGLVAPTHNYAGLSYGNIASLHHAKTISNPKEAALQGLSKMRVLMRLGIPQAVLPVHNRPNLQILRTLGFEGSDNNILQEAYKKAPHIFLAAFSSSSMWTANAATVSPSADTQDHLLHFTPANLLTHFHRATESHFTYRILKKIFSDERKFKVHTPLPSVLQLADEGAANHLRFCEYYGKSGVEVFVYGRRGFAWEENHSPMKYPARQTLEAQLAISRRHHLLPDQVIFAKQNSAVIEQGVFHNDVISMGNQTVFIYHEEAFVNTPEIVQQLKEKMKNDFYLIPISRKELRIEEAVQTYLFNSQLVTKEDGSMVLIAPLECQGNKRAMSVISRIMEEENPIKETIFVDCRQSMQNGGGPACLRLRVVLSRAELDACLASVFLNEVLYNRLVDWVKRHYRERLAPSDLLDPALLQESRQALAELAIILGLDDIYESFEPSGNFPY